MTSASSTSSTPTDASRLSVKPDAPTTGFVDGAWWPASRDLAAEVPALAAELTDRLGRIQSVSYSLGAWEPAPRKITIGTAAVRMAGYPDLHEARQVDAEDLAADLIVALDRSHLRMLRSMVPEPDRVRLLRSFDPAAPPDAEVPDPYYGGASGFTDVLTLVEAAMPGLLDWVRDRR